MEDLISVIIPIYNVEKYICRCIDSILNQTYRNMEVILVDDGSPDNCPCICDEYRKKDERIEVIHKKNGGLSDARNAGLDIAAGEYVMFIDGDDYVDQQMVEKMHNIIGKSNADMVLCNYEFVDENGVKLDKKRKEIFSENKDYIIMNEDKFWYHYTHYDEAYYVISCSKLYKTKLFESIRFPVGRINEDEFVIHKIVNKCKGISCLRDKLYYYVQRDHSITSSKISIKNIMVVDAFYQRSLYFKKNKLNEYLEPTFQLGLIKLLQINDIQEQMSEADKKIYHYYYKKWKRLSAIVLCSGSQSIKTRVKMMLFALGGIKLYKMGARLLVKIT